LVGTVMAIPLAATVKVAMSPIAASDDPLLENGDEGD
jgi:hypothetical protein